MSTDYALSTALPQAPARVAPPPSLGKRAWRRVRAVARLAARRMRGGRRYADLMHLDEASLRDLGLTRAEVASVVSELGGRAAATRRRTDLDVWLSASSRFRIRTIDSSL